MISQDFQGKKKKRPKVTAELKTKVCLSFDINVDMYSRMVARFVYPQGINRNESHWISDVDSHIPFPASPFHKSQYMHTHIS